MSPKMNILIINDFSFIDGGASKVAIQSAIALKEKGHNVILFTAVQAIDAKLIDSNINVISTNQLDILKNSNRLESAIQGLWNSKAKKALGEILKSLNQKDTIIHVHLWEKALSSSIIREAIDRRFKIVITLHNYVISCPNGGFYNYRQNFICDFTPLSKKCLFCNCDARHYYHKIWRVLRLYIQNNIGLLPSRVKNYIYISEMSKNILINYLPKDANLYYVKNPIDIEKEEPVDVKNNDNFIYIGRLSREKGCLLFAKAAKELNLNAVFVGDGELKDEIKSIYPKARVTGWVGKNELKEELKNARVLVFPSLWYETLGLTALEAQAKGVPVIVSDTCTAREVIKDRKTGLWFKRGDTEDLKEKVKIMMNNDLIEAYGKNAYESYWKNDFSLESHINDLEKVYKDILERG